MKTTGTKLGRVNGAAVAKEFYRGAAAQKLRRQEILVGKLRAEIPAAGAPGYEAAFAAWYGARVKLNKMA